MDKAVLGKWAFLSRRRSIPRKRPEDGGYGHINLRKKLQAEWANHVVALIDGNDSWMHLWKQQLRMEYSGIDADKLLSSTCAFRIMATGKVYRKHRPATQGVCGLRESGTTDAGTREEEDRTKRKE
eukprot:6811409-Prymnesium_polylepis.1